MATHVRQKKESIEGRKGKMGIEGGGGGGVVRVISGEY